MIPEHIMQQMQMQGMQGGRQQQGIPGLPPGLNPQMSEEDLLRYIQQNHPEVNLKIQVLKKQMEKMQEQNKSKTKPLTNQEYAKLQYKIENLLDEEGGIVIEPTIGFVIKTTDSHKEKIFINVVSHEIIDLPEEKLMLDYENQPGLRIPMSVGQLKEDFDKSKPLILDNKICKVIDVVLNPKIVEEMQKDINFQATVMNLFEYYFQEKHKILLKGKMTIPKLNYKGKSIEFQRVKGKKAPKIDVLETTEEEQKQQEFMNKQKQDIVQQQKKPDFDIYVLYDDGTEEFFDEFYDKDRLKSLELRVDMPLLVTGKFIRLEVSRDEIYIKNGKIYELILKMPVMVDEDQVKATFDNETRVLKLILQISEKDEEIANKVQQNNVNRPKRQDVSLGNDLLDDLV